MNFAGGGGADLAGFAPIADLMEEVTDMQVSLGGIGGLGIQQDSGGIGQGLTFGNTGDLAGAE